MSVDLRIVERFIGGVARVPSLDGLTRVLGDCSSELGFHYFSYVTARKLGEDPMRTANPIVIGNYDPEWLKRHINNDYQYADPALAAGKRARSMYCWGGDVFTRRQPPRYRKMMNELRDFGVKRGLTVPLHGFGGESGYLSLSMGDRDVEFDQIAEASRIQVSLIAPLTEDFAPDNFVDSPPEPSAMLTDRETECLLWAADGKTAEETATILGCREVTVRFHLVKAARKLGATGKIGAIVKAQKQRRF